MRGDSGRVTLTRLICPCGNVTWGQRSTRKFCRPACRQKSHRRRAELKERARKAGPWT